jgi:hypothetical protein
VSLGMARQLAAIWLEKTLPQLLCFARSGVCRSIHLSTAAALTMLAFDLMISNGRRWSPPVVISIFRISLLAAVASARLRAQLSRAASGRFEELRGALRIFPGEFTLGSLGSLFILGPQLRSGCEFFARVAQQSVYSFRWILRTWFRPISGSAGQPTPFFGHGRFPSPLPSPAARPALPNSLFWSNPRATRDPDAWIGPARRTGH